MLTDNNRRSLVSGLLTPMLPYILLGRVHTVHGIGITARLSRPACMETEFVRQLNGIRDTYKLSLYI